MSTDTPRSDALWSSFPNLFPSWPDIGHATIEHARQLERELAAAQSRIAELETRDPESHWNERYVECKAERDTITSYCDRLEAAGDELARAVALGICTHQAVEAWIAAKEGRPG